MAPYSSSSKYSLSGSATLLCDAYSAASHVVSLQKGDTVWVELDGYGGGNIYDGNGTSGYQLCCLESSWVKLQVWPIYGVIYNDAVVLKQPRLHRPFFISFSSYFY